MTRNHSLQLFKGLHGFHRSFYVIWKWQMFLLSGKELVFPIIHSERISSLKVWPGIGWTAQGLVDTGWVLAKGWTQ